MADEALGNIRQQIGEILGKVSAQQDRQSEILDTVKVIEDRQVKRWDDQRVEAEALHVEMCTIKHDAANVHQGMLGQVEIFNKRLDEDRKVIAEDRRITADNIEKLRSQISTVDTTLSSVQEKLTATRDRLDAVATDTNVKLDSMKKDTSRLALFESRVWRLGTALGSFMFVGWWIIQTAWHLWGGGIADYARDAVLKALHG